MNKTVEKAMEILNEDWNEIGYYTIPDVEINDVCKLYDVWDGEGEVPADSYSYVISHDGEDGDSNVDVCINYEFEIINQIEKNDINPSIRITSIYLI